MCNYLAGLMIARRTPDESLLDALKDEATRSGYHLQLNEEIPDTLQHEILRLIPGAPSAILFNITTNDCSDCIEEVFIHEIQFPRKMPFQDVAFFRFLRQMFKISKPERTTVVYAEGGRTGWSPMEKRGMPLEEFMQLVYEYNDRRDRDIRGVYEIVI